MIPKVSVECLQSIIGQEGRDIQQYTFDSIQEFEDTQPIMAAVAFNDMEAIIQNHAEEYSVDDDSAQTLAIKMKGILSICMRALRAQDEVNQLEEMYA